MPPSLENEETYGFISTLSRRTVVGGNFPELPYACVLSTTREFTDNSTYVASRLLNDLNGFILNHNLVGILESDSIIKIIEKTPPTRWENIANAIYLMGPEARRNYKILISPEVYSDLQREFYSRHSSISGIPLGIPVVVDGDLPDDKIIIYNPADFYLDVSNLQKEEFNYNITYTIHFNFRVNPVGSFDYFGLLDPSAYEKPSIGIIYTKYSKDEIVSKNETSQHGKINKLTEIE